MESKIIEFIKNDDYIGFNKIEADIDWIDDLDASIIRHLIDKLESPNSVSSQIMGIFYTIGVTTKDYIKAFNNYKTSARLGNPYVYCDLAFMYFHGYGIMTNKRKAIKYVLKCIDIVDDIKFTNAMVYDLKIWIRLDTDLSSYLVDKFLKNKEKYTELKIHNKELEKRIKNLEAENIELKYRPDSIGYQEAKSNFDSLLNS